MLTYNRYYYSRDAVLLWGFGQVEIIIIIVVVQESRGMNTSAWRWKHFIVFSTTAAAALKCGGAGGGGEGLEML